jgi:hypothetical protein
MKTPALGLVAALALVPLTLAGYQNTLPPSEVEKARLFAGELVMTT